MERKKNLDTTKKDQPNQGKNSSTESFMKKKNKPNTDTKKGGRTMDEQNASHGLAVFKRKGLMNGQGKGI